MRAMTMCCYITCNECVPDILHKDIRRQINTRAHIHLYSGNCVVAQSIAIIWLCGECQSANEALFRSINICIYAREKLCVHNCILCSIAGIKYIRWEKSLYKLYNLQFIRRMGKQIKFTRKFYVSLRSRKVYSWEENV